jgi:site-specific recombinase XerD
MIDTFLQGVDPDALEEKPMLNTVFSHPAWLSLIRSTPAFPFLDEFITTLSNAGYRAQTIQEHVRAAAHLSSWLERRKRSLTDLDASEAQAFKGHLARCQCAGFKRRAKDDARGAELFLQHLRGIGLVTQPAPQTPQQPPLLLGFCQWMRQHRGAKDATLNAYGRVILDALQSLGDDAAQFDARGLRAFVLDRAPRYGRSKAKQVVTALRTFVRYLIAQGFCPVGLDAAIPIIAGWKLAALPRYLPAADVEHVLAGCDPAAAIGTRDRAALLLLSRLGLRAGDVSNLRWCDIDWHQATVEVMGKSQRAVRLPLSQEVGDALLHHLANAPGAVQSDYIFLSSTPPLGRALGSSGISCIVRRAIARAGVQAPARGAHVMRHSAATSLLAQGASLQSIGVLLRHRLLDTTTAYAKVDFKVLSALTRPWPEVSP